MKRTIFLFLQVLVISLPLSASQRHSSQNPSESYISVKDFGAKGDGISDDTRAIQNAVNFAEKQGFSILSIPNVYYKNNIYVGGYKTIFFPLGRYVISKPIKVGDYIRLFGENSLLIPTASAAGKIDCIDAVAWQAVIKSLQFVGFKTALRLDNNNLDVGKIYITDCSFLNNDCAIYLSAQSSITTILNNRFHCNRLSLNLIKGDKVEFSNNWVTSSQLYGVHPSQIINYGVLHFDKNLLVPTQPTTGTVEPAWINNYGSITVNNVRQGGEPGSFTLINNFAIAETKYPASPNAVIVRDSECYGVYGGGNGYFPPAVLRLINIPNQIILSGIRGIVDAKLLDYSQRRLKNDFTVANLKLDTKVVQIQVQSISGERFYHLNGKDIPDELIKYLR